MKKIGLNSNQLKLIAAVCMLCDHVGYMLFPQVAVLRIIGRVSYPIFAFSIAEGCRYTKNRLRYLLRIAVCGAVFQIFYSLAEGFDNKINIFGTLSVAIILIYLFDAIGRAERLREKLFNAGFFLLAVGFVYLLLRKVKVDYGFYGAILPLFAFVFKNRWLRLLSFSAGLLLLSWVSSWDLQFFSILSIPLLALHNGEYGSKRFQYWFYIFYAVHIPVIYFVGMMIGDML